MPKLLLLVLLSSFGSLGQYHWSRPRHHARQCCRMMSCGPFGPPGWRYGLSEDTCVYGNTERKQNPFVDSRRRTEKHREDVIILMGVPGIHALKVGSMLQSNPQPRYNVIVSGSLAIRVSIFADCLAMQGLRDPLPCEYACKIQDAEATFLGRSRDSSRDMRTVSLRTRVECGYYVDVSWTSFGSIFTLESIHALKLLEADDPAHDDLSSCNPSPPPQRSFTDRTYYLTNGQLEWSSPEASIFPPVDSCPVETFVIRRKLPWTELPTPATVCHPFAGFVDSFDLSKFGAYCRGSGCWSQYMCHCPGHLLNLPVYTPKLTKSLWNNGGT